MNLNKIDYVIETRDQCSDLQNDVKQRSSTIPHSQQMQEPGGNLLMKLTVTNGPVP